MTTSTTVEIEVAENTDTEMKEVKRKQPDSETSPTNDNNKKRITTCGETQMEDSPIIGNTSEEVTGQLFTELLEMKSMIGNVSLAMTQMQMDNKVWIAKIATVEKDLSEVKDSVEMAHSLIDDETKARKEDIKQIRNSITDRVKEITDHSTLIKNQASDHKATKDIVKQMDGKMSSLDKDVQWLKGTVNSLCTRQPDEQKVEFPVKSTLVAQNVWY